MSSKIVHERLYHGAEALAKLRDVQLVLRGAGALGSNLADNLARQDFWKLRVIDHDRIEEHNVGTQLYGESEVGGLEGGRPVQPTVPRLRRRDRGGSEGIHE